MLTFEAMTRQIDDFFAQRRPAPDFQTARTVSRRLEEEAAAKQQSPVGIIGPALARAAVHRSVATATLRPGRLVLSF
jgi:hypothetical protein